MVPLETPPTVVLHAIWRGFSGTFLAAQSLEAGSQLQDADTAMVHAKKLLAGAQVDVLTSQFLSQTSRAQAKAAEAAARVEAEMLTVEEKEALAAKTSAAGDVYDAEQATSEAEREAMEAQFLVAKTEAKAQAEKMKAISVAQVSRRR